MSKPVLNFSNNILSLWNQTCYLHFPLHLIFMWWLFYNHNCRKPSFTKIWHHLKECSTNKPTVHTVPDQCHWIPLKNVKYPEALLWIHCADNVEALVQVNELSRVKGQDETQKQIINNPLRAELQNKTTVTRIMCKVGSFL